jgi:hypothetical protein
MTPPTFTSVGDSETGIITASEFKRFYEDEKRQEHERFIEGLIREIMERD